MLYEHSTRRFFMLLAIVDEKLGVALSPQISREGYVIWPADEVSLEVMWKYVENLANYSVCTTKPVGPQSMRSKVDVPKLRSLEAAWPTLNPQEKPHVGYYVGLADNKTGVVQWQATRAFADVPADALAALAHQENVPANIMAVAGGACSHSKADGLALALMLHLLKEWSYEESAFCVFYFNCSPCARQG